MRIQAKVALDKERHPERYCGMHRCLWRTDENWCPRHQPRIRPGLHSDVARAFSAR